MPDPSNNGRATGVLVSPKPELRAHPAVELHRVSKVYRSPSSTEDIVAVTDVSASLATGEFVSIVGPSGCGKSTLLRIVAGLIPATSGEVRVGGRSNPPPGPDRAFIFQNDALLPWRKIRENVMLGLELSGTSRKQARVTAERLLRLVGLEAFAGRYPHELSGGMRQRANLARGLAVDPPVLLMDEPFGALDAQTREMMQAELLRIWLTDRKTVLFITHQIEEAVYLSDRVLVMSARPGRICREVEVDLPRPRDPEIRYSDRFTSLTREIWEALRDEVLRAARLEADALAPGAPDRAHREEAE